MPEAIDLQKAAIDALSNMYGARGKEIAESDIALFNKQRSDLAEVEKVHQGQLFNEMCRGFLHLAAKGYAFVPEDRLTQEFGMTLAQANPDASACFIRCATTYWTLKALAGDLWLSESHTTRNYTHLLKNIEFEIGAVFFPSTGPIRFNIGRAAVIRARIADAGAPIDPDEFRRRGSPSTIHAGSGCGSSLVAQVLIVMCAVLLYWNMS